MLILLIPFANARAPNFDLNEPIIKVVMKDNGDSIFFPLRITNNGEAQKFDMKINFINNSINSDNYELVLSEEEIGTFNLNINTASLDSGVHVGNIVITGKDGSSFVPIILEIESEQVLFDLTSESPPFIPGKPFTVPLKIYNLRSFYPDATIHTYISDFNRNILFTNSKKVLVDRQIQIEDTFSIPKEISEGDYVFYAYIQDINKTSIGTTSFSFSNSKGSLIPNNKNNLLFFYIFLIASFSAIMFVGYYFLHHKIVVILANNRLRKAYPHPHVLHHPNKELHRKLQGKNKKKELKRLKSDLKALDITYQDGYMQKGAYRNAKEKIRKFMERLKKKPN
jgi:hypothetical protein